MEKISKISFKVNKIFYYLFKERFSKKINFNFPKNISRWDLIKETINRRNFNSYLEIGCDENHSFNKINVPKKIGVDPYIGGNFRGTSDEFFNINKDNFDCIFIDGLHKYDQVYKDIVNSIKFLNKNGIIFIHDTLPSSIHHQAVPRYKNVWNGDVWKAIVYFRTKSDLDIITCNIDHGVSIIQKKTNMDKIDLFQKNFKKLKFKDFYQNYHNFMRIFNYEDTLKYLNI